MLVVDTFNFPRVKGTFYTNIVVMLPLPPILPRGYTAPAVPDNPPKNTKLIPQEIIAGRESMPHRVGRSVP